MNNILNINTKPIKTMNLAALADQCIYRLPGCSDLMLRKEMQKVIVEMCEYTSALIFPITIEIHPLVNTYYIPLPFDYVSCRVDSVKTSHPETSRITPDDVEIDWEPVPRIIFKKTYTKEELAQIENGDNARPFEITVNINAMPTLGTDDYPESFLRRWQSTIVSGTLARLFSMADKPWSDATHASIEANAYNNGLNDIAVRRLTNGIKRFSSINKNNAYKSHWFI